MYKEQHNIYNTVLLMFFEIIITKLVTVIKRM